MNDLQKIPENDSRKKTVIIFDRESFRTRFADRYATLDVNNFQTLYSNLYTWYEHAKTFGIIPKPEPKSPQELGDKITDDNVIELEADLGAMFQFGLNMFAQTMDISAGRTPLFRDPTQGDGSYLDSLKRHQKDHQ